MRRLAALLLLALLASCARCGGARSAGSAAELVPAAPAGAAFTAPLARVAEHLAALQDRAASLPGGEQLGEARKSFAAQLGFDPLARDGLVSAGLDADRGAAVAFFPGRPRSEWTMALPVQDQDRFLRTVQRILVERSGFVAVAGSPSESRLFERAGSRVGVAVVRGYGMIALAADPAPRLVAPAIEQSLARAQGPRTARQQLGAQDLVVWMPRGSDLAHRFTRGDLPGDAAVSLQGSANGIASRLVAQLPEADAARARAILTGGGAALVELLPSDAPLRARLGIAPAELLASARRQPDLAAVLEKLGGADADVAASIAPGVALSIAVEKTAKIAAAMDDGLDFRKRSPFDTLQLVALARVTDLPRLTKALLSVATALPSLGARVQRNGDDFTVTYPGGKGPRFGVRAIDGQPVVYLLGGTVTPVELKRTARPQTGEGAALYADPGATLRIDFGRLAATLSALPDSSYGSGPQAYVARSVVSQVIEPLRQLRLTFDAQTTADHFGSSLDVEIAP
jgi:hypothetical protein